MVLIQSTNRPYWMNPEVSLTALGGSGVAHFQKRWYSKLNFFCAVAYTNPDVDPAHFEGLSPTEARSFEPENRVDFHLCTSRMRLYRGQLSDYFRCECQDT